MKKNNKITLLKKGLTNFFFPKYCLVCGQLNSWLCSKCFQNIKMSTNSCPICSKKNPSGQICPLCRYREGEKGRSWIIDSLVWGSSYQEMGIKSLILALKYGGVSESAKILGKILMKKLRQIKISSKTNSANIIITCLPIKPSRKRQRGYNQSELLAKEIARQGAWKFIDGLKINKFGKRQTGRRVRQRWNKINQLVWVKSSLKGKTLIIVDDVITSGATINEAARALKEMEAKNILGLTVAKG